MTLRPATALVISTWTQRGRHLWHALVRRGVSTAYLFTTQEAPKPQYPHYAHRISSARHELTQQSLHSTLLTKYIGVGIAKSNSNWLWAGWPVFDSEQRPDFSLHSVHTGSGAQPASYPMSSRGSSYRCKEAQEWS
jgi:hypothetical protein